jgi:hypothetical protein
MTERGHQNIINVETRKNESSYLQVNEKMKIIMIEKQIYNNHIMLQIYMKIFFPPEKFMETPHISSSSNLKYSQTAFCHRKIHSMQ